MINSKNYSIETLWRSKAAVYLKSKAIINNFSKRITNLTRNTTKQTYNCIKKLLPKKKMPDKQHHLQGRNIITCRAAISSVEWNFPLNIFNGTTETKFTLYLLTTSRLPTKWNTKIIDIYLRIDRFYTIT